MPSPYHYFFCYIIQKNPGYFNKLILFDLEFILNDRFMSGYFRDTPTAGQGTRKTDF